MTNPDEDAGQKASSDSGAGASEPTSSSFEAPPIEQAKDQQAQADEQPAYPPPPAYDPSGYQPPQAYPPTPGSFPPPDYSGYPPPGQPGYAPPYPDPATGYGTPAYPPPPYGAPPPEFGPPPGGYQASGYDAYGVPGQKTNSMAIASLVASVVGVCCGIGSIIGIVLGFVAINQIKRTGENGQGLAIAGIAIGALTFLISLVWTIAVMGT
jgi:hypothetical protein